ncbi:MAG: LTA synthase family protein [Clostridia bacterium]|nr:LTA synthase family protein [Clostridia bacterium]
MKMIKNCFLFARDPAVGRKKAFWLWNGGCVVLLALLVGVMALRLACGDHNGTYFPAYFHSFALLPGNLLPPLLLILTLWLLLGRAWAGFLLGGLVSLGFPLTGYYVLRFRNEPLTPDLLQFLREAVSISATAKYDLTPDGPVWAALALLLGGTVFLALAVRGRPRPRALFWLPVIVALLLEPACRDNGRYAAALGTVADPYSATHTYIARGFWYPFLHGLLAEEEELLILPEPSEEQQEQEAPPPTAEELLARYTDSAIPEERKIDLLVFQREAYVDFSVYDVEGMDWSCYDLYHQLQAESYSGTLVTNIFAGGTVDTERCVLTGLYRVGDLPETGDLNSYVRYLKEQGYTVEGCHPCYEWFYDRKTINARLGFDRYRFSEDTFSELSGQVVAYDDILMPVVWEMYQEKTADGTPYFGYHVTYQGHGPYTATWVQWPGAHFAEGALEGEPCNIFNNYLGSLRDSDVQLMWLVENLRNSDRPAALLVYGDHKPWLGDQQEVYKDLGISLDLGTEEGLLNYLTTPYLLWINPAAEALLGKEIRGTGPAVSPCYLMNLVFEQLGWEGNAFSKLMDDYRQVMPVISTVGRYVVDGRLVSAIPEERQAMAQEFLSVQDLWKHRFLQ